MQCAVHILRRRPTVGFTNWIDRYRSNKKCDLTGSIINKSESTLTITSLVCLYLKSSKSYAYINKNRSDDHVAFAGDHVVIKVGLL